MQLDLEQNKAKFIEYCTENIHREGLDKVLDYLEKTDFYSAPSSTNFHLNIPGGLCLHSINVFETAIKLTQHILVPAVKGGASAFSDIPSVENIAIAALFHDLTKIEMYHEAEKWTKDEAGRWCTYKAYEVKDDFPFGHGEKSCYRLLKYMELNRDELLAIRWHMGMFDMGEQGSSQRLSFRRALETSSLVAIIHAADFLSSNLMEKTIDLKAIAAGFH